MNHDLFPDQKIAALEGVIEKLRAELEDKSEQIEYLEERVICAECDRDEADQERYSLQVEKSSLEEANEQLEEDAANLEEERDKLKEENENLEDDISELQEEIEMQTKAILDLNEKIAKLTPKPVKECNKARKLELED